MGGGGWSNCVKQKVLSRLWHFCHLYIVGCLLKGLQRGGGGGEGSQAPQDPLPPSYALVFVTIAYKVTSMFVRFQMHSSRTLLNKTDETVMSLFETVGNK